MYMYIHVYILYIYIYIYIYTFCNLKFNVLQSSGISCYILKKVLLTSKLYLDKISKTLL